MIIDDLSLAQQGAQRIQWYREQMTVLKAFRKRYKTEKPFAGKRLLVCMHCEPKAAVRTEVLLEGGAEHITFVGNLGSTKPDMAAYLSTFPQVDVMARQGDTLEDLNSYVKLALDMGPYDLFMDNGASIMLQYASRRFDWQVLGGIEETRSGRLLLDENHIDPAFPWLVIDDSPVKRLIENETGVGQSVVDGFMRQTSMLVGGKKILIIGYGWCGTGIAQRFRALGALTSVYDTDPIRLLKAKIEGHKVGALDELIPEADVVLTVTGRFHVMGEREMLLMKDGAILCNAGHYNMEIDLTGLERKYLQPGVEKADLANGRTIYILQNANPLNLSAGAGNPIEIMELGYALQLLSLEAVMKDKTLSPGIQPLPDAVNDAACVMCLGFDPKK